MSALRHPDFRVQQQRLSKLGLYTLPIDDEYGPGMSAALDQLLARAETAAGIPAPAAPQWPNLDSRYAWLRNVGPVPRHLGVALGLLGTLETAGAGNTPLIMQWRDDCLAAGLDVKGYHGDAVPWCGLFMAAVMLAAQRQPVDAPLWALNWNKFGVDGGQPELGDVLTFMRDGGGHVALYIGEDAQGFYHVLGGNQSDKVSIARIAKSRMKACRQPPYTTKPASVRPYLVSAAGSVSRNEA